MAIKRYWRLVGIRTPTGGTLELSELRLYEGGALADASATLTATIAPASGALTDLRDGVATGVVSWPYASYSQPGFALVWDFGLGGGVVAPTLRLGSGAYYSGFPFDVVMQTSEDGNVWGPYKFANAIVYPGANAITPAAPEVADPYASDVSLLLKGLGASGSTTIIDSSATPKTIAVFGDTRISTAQSVSGDSSIYFDGAGDYLTTPHTTALSLVSESFTVEAWIHPTGLTSGNMNIVNKDGVAGASYSQYDLAISSTGKLVGFLGNGNGVSPTGTNYTGTQAVTLNAWQHVAMVKDANGCRGYLGGVKQWDAAAPAMYEGSKSLIIGYQTAQPDSSLFNGYMQFVSITKGIARYTENFTPAISSYELLAVSNPAKPHASHLNATPARLIPAVELPTSAVQGHLREYPFFDAYNGGIGTITGTVKEKNTPANTPLRRRVLLIDEASRMTIRETWSDPETGAFEFRGIKQGVKYSTISYDHLHNYRAVIADNQDAA